MRRAGALIAEERFPDAIHELRLGTELSPPGAATAWWLADGALAAPEPAIPSRRGPRSREVALLAAATRAQETELSSWALRALHGWLLLDAGKIDAGANDLAAAARRKGSRADLWQLLARAELERQNIVGADAAHRELARLAPREVSLWHRQQADQHEKSGRPLLVAWHLGHLLPDLPRSPSTGQLFARRGEALAKLARWQEAADDLVRAANLLPENDSVRFRQAEFLFAANDLAGYRSVCQGLLRRWPDNQDKGYQVARICLLGPDALADMNPVVRLAEWSMRPLLAWPGEEGASLKIEPRRAPSSSRPR